jgi:hypothetical protein
VKEVYSIVRPERIHLSGLTIFTLTGVGYLLLEINTFLVVILSPSLTITII